MPNVEVVAWRRPKLWSPEDKFVGKHTLTMLKQVEMELKCEMDFYEYPFDQQVTLKYPLQLVLKLELANFKFLCFICGRSATIGFNPRINWWPFNGFK